eukprot:TRINITY_DN18331_c0_g1_i1.p2 TRINITY_DN18331_c0_g1~~TRINITY_DN18331_c0_g1_i1.p2  ORF type:complete len:130 (-),score=18.79 TRINITY_DN18331_c0_g1_i1:31-420(-)
MSSYCDRLLIFFFNDTATTEIYTLHIVGSVRCVQETGAELDDDVLEDLVDEVAHVDVAVGVGGAVVEDPFAFGVRGGADLLVEVLVLPEFDHGGFARGEVGFHVEVGFGEVEGVFVVGRFGGHGDHPFF